MYGFSTINEICDIFSENVSFNRYGVKKSTMHQVELNVTIVNLVAKLQNSTACNRMFNKRSMASAHKAKYIFCIIQIYGMKNPICSKWNLLRRYISIL